LEVMADNHDDLVAQFRDITGVDNERARFFLEASGWQLPLATQSFFDSEGDNEGGERMVQDQEDSDPEVDAETRQRFEQNLAGMLRQMIPGGAAAAAAAAAGGPGVGAPKPKKEKKPAGPRTGVMTLDSMRNQESEDDSSDDEDKGQAFYAGGSQSSGQQVLGPPRRRDELVAEMFKRAKEHGAQEVEGPPQMIKRKTPSGGGGAFSGAGHKLGDTTEGAETVGTSSANAKSANSESREVVLRLWSTGFTVNEGQLRSYQDPANMEFLSAVKRGEVPRELIREYQGQEVEMTMEDKRHEDYAPPRNQVQAFTGKGHTLGSPAPATVGSAPSAPLTDGDRKANETAAREQVPLVDGAPTTNIQFRLVDGTRLVARFNPAHTVNDLHSYINVARPQYAASNYVLTLFPNTELTDKTQTLESAKLSNAALIQKIKQ